MKKTSRENDTQNVIEDKVKGEHRTATLGTAEIIFMNNAYKI